MQLFTLITQLSIQSWIAAGIAAGIALLIGLVLPRRNAGGNVLAGLLFWPLSLLRDLLDAAHSKRMQYYALLLALLGMEAFFSLRAATVYYDVLNKRMAGLEVGAVSGIVFLAVFLCGYMVASHGVRSWGSFWIAALVVLHDVAGTLWLNYGPGASGSSDWTSVSITIGMCAFSLVPFALGSRAESLRPELEEELDQEVETFTSQATRTIKRRAVDRVLRLAGRTDIIHLVRSLPAHEFAEFKAFVMPIIAPGVSHSLDNSAHQDEQIRLLSADIEQIKMLLPPAGTGPHTDPLRPAMSGDEPKTAEIEHEKPLVNESAGSEQPTKAVLFESKEQAVLAALEAYPGADVKQIATAAGCSIRTAQRWIDKLAPVQQEQGQEARK